MPTEGRSRPMLRPSIPAAGLWGVRQEREGEPTVFSNCRFFLTDQWLAAALVPGPPPRVNADTWPIEAVSETPLLPDDRRRRGTGPAPAAGQGFRPRSAGG